MVCSIDPTISFMEREYCTLTIVLITDRDILPKFIIMDEVMAPLTLTNNPK